jgi:hypothetical protein
MLIIGSLNQKEPVLGANAAPAVPLPAALTARGGLLDAVGDVTQHPAVRAAALVGILRHAESNLPQASQGPVLAKVTAILKEKPTDAAAAESLAWMKMRAADVCGALGSATSSGDLAAMVVDATLPVNVRCAAAKALGSLKSIDGAALKMPELVAALGNLQLEVCYGELDRALADGDVVNPRQIHYQSGCVQTALSGDGKNGGVSKLIKADAAEKALATNVAKASTDILALVPDENASADDGIKAAAQELEKLLVDAKVLRGSPRASGGEADATAPEAAPPKAAAATPAAAAMK